MNNLKRFTVCKLAGHKYVKVAYPPSADGEVQVPSSVVSDVKENHDAGTVARGPGPMI